MREILFKAKRKDNGEWVAGCYVNSGIHKKQGRKLHFILEDESECYDDVIEVIPETVCQYTGLKDKNGKKIFEGDIIIFLNSYENEIIFKYGAFGYDSHKSYGGLENFVELKNYHFNYNEKGEGQKIEVTGNIHD